VKVSVEKRWLLEAIRARLLPEFVRRGFEVVPLSDEDARGEIRAAFPFGRLRRKGVNGFELIEVQLHPRDLAKFRINLGIAPPRGIDHFVGRHLAPEDIWVTYLDQYYEVYSSAIFRKWFAVRRGWWSKRPITEDDYHELIDRVRKLVPEIAQVFSGIIESRTHIRRIG
jgi:hypothetical protein